MLKTDKIGNNFNLWVKLPQTLDKCEFLLKCNVILPAKIYNIINLITSLV